LEILLAAVVVALSRRTKDLVFIHIVIVVLHDVLWKAVRRRVRRHEAGEVLEIEAVDKMAAGNSEVGVWVWHCRYCRCRARKADRVVWMLIRE